MKASKNFLLITVLALMIGCSSGDDETTKPPGEQNLLIDRAGRAYMTELFLGTFRSADARDALLDSYNVTPAQSVVATFQSEINHSLAAYDALRDQTSSGSACGDNPLTNRASIDDEALATNINRYNAFSEFLLDDQIYIDKNAGATCDTFMAVELSFMGENQSPDSGDDPGTDCGGQKPIMDVVQTYYTIALQGSSAGPGLDDSVGPGVPELETFPFLAAPIPD